MKTAILFLIPLLLLGGVILLFLATDGAGLDAEPTAPIEALDVERIRLEPGLIELRVRNTGPEPLSLSFAAIRDMVVRFELEPPGELPRMGRALVSIPYPWVEAEAYEILLFSANSIPFAANIEAASATREADAGSLLGYTLIGIYVGVIPVFLGILWLPALRRLGKTAFDWLMALTLGLLLFLALDALAEALEQAAGLGAPFQGPGLIGMGLALAFLSLASLSGRRTSLPADEEGRGRRVALMISAGIGLHNFGEGLAIGAAFSAGAANLGTFFVIGFILQNITEGLGIIAPILKQRPSAAYLAGLGLLGGAPAVAGAWLGGLSPSPAFSVLALALGAGAVLEVAWEIGKLIAKRTETLSFSVSSGVLAGMGLLYLTGILVK